MTEAQSQPPSTEAFAAASGQEVEATAAAAAAAQAHATASAMASSFISDNGYSIKSQLDRAAAKVYKNKETADRLFATWRFSLLRLSYLVILITLHQAQAPITDCIKSIKAINQSIETNTATTRVPISLWKAFQLLWTDSICEVISIILACFLASFLCESPFREFASSRYRMAVSMIPLVLSLYYYKKPMGCLQGSSWESDLDHLPLQSSLSSSLRMGGFPVVLIFHAMVTASVLFMLRQRKHHEANIAVVENLQKEMAKVKTNANSNPKRS